jgi:hypothetical protein
MLGTPDEDVYVNCQEAAYVIEAQAKRIAGLEEIVEGTIDLAKENLRLIKRVGELEAELEKVKTNERTCNKSSSRAE